MPDQFILFAPPLLGEEEKEEILDTLNSGWITTGPKTKRFENEMAEYIGVKAAVGVFSCTSALHLSLLALDIKTGDEVITPTFSFASTAHVVEWLGATPVFIDIDPRSFNIDVNQIEDKITERTKAIMPVHYGGQPCNMQKVLEIARKQNLFVVEDAAHAVGAEYDGKKIGALGSNFTCFSFYATKNIATAEGGMIVSNDGLKLDLIRKLAMYGISDAREIWGRYSKKGTWEYDVQYLGYKCNMMDIVASLGIHQLRKLDNFIIRREENRAIYDSIFSKIPEIKRPNVSPNIKHAWHLYSILIDFNKLSIDRDDIINILKDKGIGTSVLFKPLHLHSYYKNKYNYKLGEFPVSEYVFKHIINLPISPATTVDDIEYVGNTLKRIIEESRK